MPRVTTHVFANATMPSSTERLVHALGPFANGSIAIVRLLSGKVSLEGSSSLAIRINPAVRVPFRMVLPDIPVDLGECWGSGDSMTLGDDILAASRRGGKGTGDHDVGDDRALC